MIYLTTNHKVGDVVYVVGSCVRRGTVQKVTFCQQNDTDNQFALSYSILYDGYSYNTEVESEVDYNVSGTGSPRFVGSPVNSGSPLGSPAPGGVGSPLAFNIAVEEITNGGDIYTDKNTALTAFGDTLG